MKHLICAVFMTMSYTAQGSFRQKHRIEEQDSKAVAQAYVPKYLPYATALQHWKSSIQKGTMCIPDVICTLIAEYAVSYTWKRTGSVPVSSAAVCAYIPHSCYGPLLAIGGEPKHTSGALYSEAIRLITYEGGTIITSLDGHIGRIRSLLYSARHALLISAADDATMRFWKIRSDNPRQSTYMSTLTGMVRDMVLSSDEERLVTVSGTTDYRTTSMDIVSLASQKVVSGCVLENYGAASITWHHAEPILFLYGFNYIYNSTSTRSHAAAAIVYEPIHKVILQKITFDKQPLPEVLINLSRHNQIYYHSLNSGTLSVSSMDKRVITDEIPLSVCQQRRLIASPQQNYVACIGYDNVKGHGDLAIIDTGSHEKSIPLTADECFKHYDPIVFTSEESMIVCGRIMRKNECSMKLFDPNVAYIIQRVSMVPHIQ